MSQVVGKKSGEGEHELITSETQGGFCQAKKRRLMLARLAYMVMYKDDEKDEDGINRWAKGAKEGLPYAPFKVLKDKDKTAEMIDLQHAHVKMQASDMMLQPEQVGMKMVYLSEQMQASVSAKETPFLQMQALQNVIYKRDDLRTMLNFDQDLEAALKDGKLLDTNVLAYLEKVFVMAQKVRSASTADKLPDTELVGRVVFKITEKYKDVQTSMSIQAKVSNTPTTWDEMREGLLDAERTLKPEKEETESDEEKEVPSAQVGFRDQQQQDGYSGGRDGYKGGGRGRGGKGGRGRGRGGKGGKGGEDDDRVRKCFVCESVDHLAQWCPRRGELRDEGS